MFQAMALCQLLQGSPVAVDKEPRFKTLCTHLHKKLQYCSSILNVGEHACFWPYATPTLNGSGWSSSPSSDLTSFPPPLGHNKARDAAATEACPIQHSFEPYLSHWWRPGSELSACQCPPISAGCSQAWHNFIEEYRNIGMTLVWSAPKEQIMVPHLNGYQLWLA